MCTDEFRGKNDWATGMWIFLGLAFQLFGVEYGLLSFLDFAFYEAELDLEMKDLIYFSLEMPFELVELVLKNESCFSDFEEAVLYDWPGTGDACDCDSGRKRNDCQKEDLENNCLTTEGLNSEELERWPGTY